MLKAVAKLFAKFLTAWRLVFKRHLNDGFSGPAREQVNQIDGIARRLHSQKIAADLDIFGPGFTLDDFQGLNDLPFRFFDSSAGRHPKPDANQRRIRVRKDLGSYARKVDIQKPD